MFVLAGFTTLAFAAISWKLETSESYWIWHRYNNVNRISLSLSLSLSLSHVVHKMFCSLWHVSIYTSSFFFLYSKEKIVNSENRSPPNGNYELTRQNSRDEQVRGIWIEFLAKLVTVKVRSNKTLLTASTTTAVYCKIFFIRFVYFGK